MEVNGKIDNAEFSGLCRLLTDLSIEEPSFELKENSLVFRGINPEKTVMFEQRISVSELTGNALFCVDANSLKTALSCLDKEKIRITVKESGFEVRDGKNVFELPLFEAEKTEFPNPITEAVFKAYVNGGDLRNALSCATKIGASNLVLDNAEVLKAIVQAPKASYFKRIELKSDLNALTGIARICLDLKLLKPILSAVSEPTIEFSSSKPLKVSQKDFVAWIAPRLMDEEPKANKVVEIETEEDEEQFDDEEGEEE